MISIINTETLLVVMGLLVAVSTLRCVLLYNENNALKKINDECMEASETQSKRAARFSAEVWELKELLGKAVRLKDPETGRWVQEGNSLPVWISDESAPYLEDPIEIQTFAPLYEPKAISIAGPARSGKDTAADYLLTKLGPEWSITSFAEPIKKMLEVIGVDCSDEAKDIVDPRFGVTPRHMMQTLGTEWGRGMIKWSIWEDIVEEKIQVSPRIVKDVRFDGEADLGRKYGPLLHMLGRGGIPGQHSSEAGVSFEVGDIEIHNDGTEQHLYKQLDTIKI